MSFFMPDADPLYRVHFQQLAGFAREKRTPAERTNTPGWFPKQPLNISQ